jgi:alkylation response protein AidB-like acyl-CoA dehydrogenase
METESLVRGIQQLAEDFARDRHARQRQRVLDPRDFDRLREVGFLLTGVPVAEGGLWEDERRSTRPIVELLRVLAQGDASTALVAAMHPSVLFAAGWLAVPEATSPFTAPWAEQRRQIFDAVRQGAWWGTITSEPGSGGDVDRTAATAHPAADGTYQLRGQKHFGSGWGVLSYMVTTAVPAGEAQPDAFFLDIRGVPVDGSTGATLTAPWDGHGMIATQSHGLAFADFPARRSAWPRPARPFLMAPGGFIGCCFTAVIVGIVETALATARQQLGRRRESLRAYEQVEWVRAEQEGWLIQQAYAGMLRAVEERERPGQDVLRGKTAIAELAEASTGRLCKIMGGGSYARHSPFGFWHADVRALGFLRPPWGLAYDGLFAALADTPD